MDGVAAIQCRARPLSPEGEPHARATEPVTRRTSHVGALPDGGRFVALDSWRGIAALAVAWHHISADGGLTASEWHRSLYLMVDFFFVLSGFVIAAAYGDRLAQGFSLAKYMWLRLGRIYPVHLAVVLLFVLIELARALSIPDAVEVPVPFAHPRDPADLPAVLLLAHAFTHPNVAIWNSMSWSISVELWLYLAAALGWRFAGRWAPWVALALALAALSCFVDPGPAVTQWNWALRGIGGFGLGMALWEVHRRAGVARRIGPISATVAEGLVVVLCGLLLTNPFSSALFTPACALLVIVFAQERGLLSRLLHATPFLVLGAVSYSLYMIHNVVIGRLYDLLGLVGRAVGQPLVGGPVSAPERLVGPAWRTDLLSLAMLLAIVVPAWLMWRWLENPARGWSRRRAEQWGVRDAERVAPTI